MAQFVGAKDWALQLSREVVRGFLAYLNKNHSPETMARHLATFKMFSRWMHSEGMLHDDICYGVTSLRPPRRSEKLPDVPSQEEMATLLDGPFPTAFPERDRLILEMLYNGLRVSEAANIKLNDFRPEQDALVVNGKGGMFGKAAKQRLVPLNRKIRTALDEYMIARRKALKNDQSNVLFFAVRNRYSGHLRPINVRSIARMLLFITELRGLQPMNPHLLRHACATHMLENGCPLDVIAKVLGHDNLDITAHYAQVSTRLMMKTYNAAHPHARQDLLSA